MNVKILNVISNNDVLKANEFLTRLIRDEKSMTLILMKNFIVKSFYEHLIIIQIIAC